MKYASIATVYCGCSANIHGQSEFELVSLWKGTLWRPFCSFLKKIFLQQNQTLNPSVQIHQTKTVILPNTGVAALPPTQSVSLFVLLLFSALTFKQGKITISIKGVWWL